MLTGTKGKALFIHKTSNMKRRRSASMAIFVVIVVLVVVVVVVAGPSFVDHPRLVPWRPSPPWLPPRDPLKHQ